MAHLTEKEFTLALKKGSLERVYLLYGDEPYLTRLYAGRIADKAVEAFPELNVHTFGANASLDDILIAAETTPVMSERNCVSVCDYKLSSLSNSDMEKLKAFLEDVPEYTCLIFWFDKAEFSTKKGSPLSLFAEAGAVVNFQKKKEAELVRIVCSRAGKHSVNMQPTVARYLLSLCSDDLENILRETDKLCSFVGARAATIEDVDAIVSVSAEVSVYQLSDHICAGNTQKAYATLHRLWQAKCEPEWVARTLSSAFVDVYRVKTAESEGIRPSAIAEDFSYGKRAFVLDKTSRNTRRMDRRAATKAIDLLHRCMMKIKRCEGDNKITVEETVLQLLRVCS